MFFLHSFFYFLDKYNLNEYKKKNKHYVLFTIHKKNLPPKFRDRQHLVIKEWKYTLYSAATTIGKVYLVRTASPSLYPGSHLVFNDFKTRIASLSTSGFVF